MSLYALLATIISPASDASARYLSSMAWATSLTSRLSTPSRSVPSSSGTHTRWPSPAGRCWTVSVRYAYPAMVESIASLSASPPREDGNDSSACCWRSTRYTRTSPTPSGPAARANTVLDGVGSQQVGLAQQVGEHPFGRRGQVRLRVAILGRDPPTGPGGLPWRHVTLPCVPAGPSSS